MTRRLSQILKYTNQMPGDSPKVCEIHDKVLAKQESYERVMHVPNTTAVQKHDEDCELDCRHDNQQQQKPNTRTISMSSSLSRSSDLYSDCRSSTSM